MDFINKKEQKILLKWISENQNQFVKNDLGKNRKFITLKNVANVPKIIFEIKNKILENEKIYSWQEDPFFGDIITYNSHGGFIHRHTDPTLPNKRHLRFNLFLSKPFFGGVPIYNDKKMPFSERNYTKYEVNKYFHESTPVFGFKPRIAISYGISID